MKLVILSDIHGNDIYFNRCMALIKKLIPDKIIVLGDCFGYMHEGNTILNKLRKLNAKLLLGNHEAMLLGKLQYDLEKEEIYGLITDRKTISKSNFKYMEQLEPKLYEEIDNRRILYVHGCPDNPVNGYLYADDKTYNWGRKQYDYIFMGHTHYPYIKKFSNTTYVNVGSVGLPRCNGQKPSFVVFDTQTGEVVIHEVLLNRKELEKVLLKDIHPTVCECLKRKGNNICHQLM